MTTCVYLEVFIRIKILWTICINTYFLYLFYRLLITYSVFRRGCYVHWNMMHFVSIIIQNIILMYSKLISNRIQFKAKSWIYFFLVKKCVYHIISTRWCFFSMQICKSSIILLIINIWIH
jgi:hypothetical protein|nr:MAG TPA_asm: hypothetical protein [Bacteriophage sp.]